MLVRRDAGALLVGHVAVGNGVAGLVQEAGGAEGRSWTATVLGAGEPVHGGNAAGVVCAALDGGGHPLVRVVLARAGSAEQAVGLLRDAAIARPVALLVADARQAHCVEVSPGGGVTVPEATQGASGTPIERIADAAAALRRGEPAPEEGRAPVGGLIALLGGNEPPRLHLALGPPSCSVFIRHWPGMVLTPDEAATPEGSVLARLAAAVAETTQSDTDLRAAARTRLDQAEASALEEGEAAERMAALMDADTDDRGAAVRRLVAQAHAAELARQALEELAVPAHPGRQPGARI